MQAVQITVLPLESVQKVDILSPVKPLSGEFEQPQKASFQDLVKQASYTDEKPEKENKTDAQPAEKTVKNESGPHASAEAGKQAAEFSDTAAVKIAVHQETSAAEKAGIQVKNGKVPAAAVPVAARTGTAVKQTGAKKSEKTVPEKKKGAAPSGGEIPLTEQHIRWINSAEQTASADDPEALISQAKTYDSHSKESEDMRLEVAQRKSVETPELFLNEQAAAALKTAASKDSGNNARGNDTAAGKTQKKTALDKSGKIEVTDLRMQTQTAAQNVKSEAKTVKPVTVKYDGGNEAQMTLNLADTAKQNILSSNNQTAAATGSNFQAMLSNQIEQFAGEFVKAGEVVLRDNNTGTINLTLNPEKLGNVKISLQLTDKVIAGQITVDSKEAYNAFKESADSLKQAFIQSGFDAKGFDISWSGQNAGSNFSGNQENADRQYVMAQAYGEYSTGTAEAEPAAAASTVYCDHTVNIVA